MEDNNIETKEMQEIKQSKIGTKELHSGFCFTFAHYLYQPTIKSIRDSLTVAINAAYDAGYQRRELDEAEEAEVAYERGQLDE